MTVWLPMCWTGCARWTGWRTCGTSSWARPPIADVRALPGIRYHLARAGDLSRLVAPPYDVIPEPQVARYEELSPYNVVRLTRPGRDYDLSLIHISEPTRLGMISYAVFCLKKKKTAPYYTSFRSNF